MFPLKFWLFPHSAQLGPQLHVSTFTNFLLSLQIYWRNTRYRFVLCSKTGQPPSAVKMKFVTASFVLTRLLCQRSWGRGWGQPKEESKLQVPTVLTQSSSSLFWINTSILFPFGQFQESWNVCFWQFLFSFIPVLWEKDCWSFFCILSGSPATTIIVSKDDFSHFYMIEYISVFSSVKLRISKIML